MLAPNGANQDNRINNDPSRPGLRQPVLRSSKSEVEGFGGHAQAHQDELNENELNSTFAQPARKTFKKNSIQITSAHGEEHASASRTIYKKNQPVSHEKFGVGLIQDIELRANGITYLQVKFKSGSKKLDASFLKPS